MFASCCWMYRYDVIYGDKNDDEKVGIKSTALSLGDDIRLALSVFDVIFFACLLNSVGWVLERPTLHVLRVIRTFLLCPWRIWSFDCPNAPNSVPNASNPGPNAPNPVPNAPNPVPNAPNPVPNVPKPVPVTPKPVPNIPNPIPDFTA
ncbi:hypothetical protein BDR07DRAFT_1613019 [Suillus spraguei]|nr:hypothetical protein BDR07DRAFT_1613019 [Suillus spraguei]